MSFDVLSNGFVNSSQKEWVMKLARAEFVFKIEFPGEYKIIFELRTIHSKGGRKDTNLEGGCKSHFSFDPCMDGDLILVVGCDPLQLVMIDCYGSYSFDVYYE